MGLSAALVFFQVLLILAMILRSRATVCLKLLQDMQNEDREWSLEDAEWALALACGGGATPTGIPVVAPGRFNLIQNK
jgi:hypothetical protein